MKKRRHLVTPLSILCIHKKRSELFYSQLVRIHTKGYMQKANRLWRDHSLPHTFSSDLYSHTWLQLGKYLLLYFGTTTNTWLGQDFSLPTHRCWGNHFRESVCACVSVHMCMEEFAFTPKSCSSLLGDRFHSKDYCDSCSYVLHTTFYDNRLFRKRIFYLCNFFSPLVPPHIIKCQKAQKP